MANGAGPPATPAPARKSAMIARVAIALALIPLFGALSDRYGRRPVYAVGAASAAEVSATVSATVT